MTTHHGSEISGWGGHNRTPGLRGDYAREAENAPPGRVSRDQFLDGAERRLNPGPGVRREMMTYSPGAGRGGGTFFAASSAMQCGEEFPCRGPPSSAGAGLGRECSCLKRWVRAGFPFR